MLVKYPKIFTIGSEENKDIFNNPDDEIVCEEKVDGSNFRFTFINGSLVWGSRNKELNECDAGNWLRAINFVKQKVPEYIINKYSGTGIVVYGEAMFKHSIEYDWTKIPAFLGFDILKGKIFVDWQVKNELFAELDLPIVPLLWHGSVACLPKKLDSLIAKSYFGSVEMEGIVYKNYSKQLFGKIVTNKFKEVNKAAFGMNKKHAKDDTERLVAVYCTNPRIDKATFKLMDEGNTLSMELMHLLPKLVLQDIFEEHGQEIYQSSFHIDFRRFRSLVSKRCVTVLQQIIVNNALKQGGK